MKRLTALYLSLAGLIVATLAVYCVISPQLIDLHDNTAGALAGILMIGFPLACAWIVYLIGRKLLKGTAQ